MGSSQYEYWTGLPCPSPGNLLNPGIKPVSSVSPALVDGFFTTEPPGKPIYVCVYICSLIIRNLLKNLHVTMISFGAACVFHSDSDVLISDLPNSFFQFNFLSPPPKKNRYCFQGFLMLKTKCVPASLCEWSFPDGHLFSMKFCSRSQHGQVY